jgi:hypothetical protein
MRRMLMVTAASLALGATGAMAAGNHMSGGVAAGGMAAGGMTGGRATVAGSAGTATGSPVRGMTPNAATVTPGTNMHANVRGPMVPNTATAQNNMMMHDHRYAYSGVHDHDHDRWRHHGRWGGYGGLYAYGGPLYDYDDDYYDYYDNGCYQPRWVRTPYGWRWRTVWVCQ